MEPTYTVLGGDGNQYGPVTAEQLRGWARDGRIASDTQIWRSDSPAWVAASALPELGLAAPVAAAIPAPIHVSTPAQDPELEKRVKNGASWFYTIAVLSLVNSVVAAFGSDWRFFIGLGITQVIDAVAGSMGTAGKAVGLILGLAAAGLLVLFGVFAGKRHAWASIIGGILLALDGLLVALAAFASGEGWLWVSFAFHVWAIFVIFKGFQASRALRG